MLKELLENAILEQFNFIASEQLAGALFGLRLAEGKKKMKVNACDICGKISRRTCFDVCEKHYYIFVRSGYKSEERNGRIPRMRYNIADICFACLKKLFNGETKRTPALVQRQESPAQETVTG